MTVPAQTTYTQATGNGVTTSFPFGFLALRSDEVLVSLDGVPLANGVGYSVSGLGVVSGGTINFTLPPAAGVVVLIQRNMQFTRSTDYQYQGQLPAATVNADFDRVWMALQQLGFLNFGAVRAPFPEQIMPMPRVADRAGKLLGFDPLGNPVPVVPSDQSVGSYALTLLSSIGSSLIGFLQSGIGAIYRTVQDELRDRVSVKQFGAKGDGVTDDTLAIQRALNLGGLIYMPPGRYLFSSLTIPDNTHLFGAGSKTVLATNTLGDGIINTHPVNGSYAANVTLSDFEIENTNAENNGGAFAQVCGSYINLYRVVTRNWAYGIIFDQTEHGHIRECQFHHFTVGGLWIVNGPTRTPGALNAFTNRISVTGTQFNGTGIGIIDDGGVSHKFDDNNFNGGTCAAWIAGARAVSFTNSEAEYCSQSIVKLTSTRYSNGTGVGQSFEVDISGNFIICPLNRPAIEATAGTNIRFTMNDVQSTGTSSAYVVAGGNTLVRVISEGNLYSQFAGLFDVLPVIFQRSDGSTLGQYSQTQFYAPTASTYPVRSIVPVSAGGGALCGGVGLEGLNGAGSQVTYGAVSGAIYGNTAGAEIGGVKFSAPIGGVMTYLGEFNANGIVFRPQAATPANNGDAVFSLVSNTEIRLRFRGSDGVVRQASLTLS